MEKSYLENNYELEGKAKDRMSMQVRCITSLIKNDSVKILITISKNLKEYSVLFITGGRASMEN